MRFSKKLLATLLPIATAGAIVPVVTSCNKGSSWSINYGDSINCLKKQPTKDEAAYHTIDEVKNSVKNHTSIESRTKITLGELPTWIDGEEAQQMMYYDLIASISYNAQTPFYLDWSKTAITLTIDKEETHPYTGSILTYLQGSQISGTKTEDKDKIFICIDGGTYYCLSYDFQNTTIGE